MKYSIKHQLALICAAMIAGTIVLCFVLNSFFLEDYYENKKKNAMENAYASINAASNEGSITSDSFDRELRRICETYNLDMLVMDEKTSSVISSVNNYKMMQDRLLRNLFDSEDEQNQSVKLLEKQEKYTLQIRKSDGENDEYMEMWGLLDTGNLFLISSSLEGIRDSVSIANSFLFLVAIISIAVSVIAATIVSNKITKPIMELAEVSSKMKELNFEAKYKGDSKNELAILGRNINELSEELEKNISELKTANNELKTDLENKNRIDEMRREFISNVSHELKTPIALIQGYAEGLNEGVIDDEESRQYYCEVIADEAGKMNRMVRELLTLNQLEFGNEPVQMERFDLGLLLHNYLKSVGVLLEEKKAILEAPDDTSFYAWGDEFKIQEVITNYISNAIHHVNEGGTIKVSVISDDKKIKVSVFNTGSCIPEESIPFIWDKFYKVDKARTRAYGGTGIGLSIVKAIMDSMHEEYGVENMADGVQFWFELDKA